MLETKNELASTIVPFLFQTWLSLQIFRLVVAVVRMKITWHVHTTKATIAVFVMVGSTVWMRILIGVIMERAAIDLVPTLIAWTPVMYVLLFQIYRRTMRSMIQ